VSTNSLIGVFDSGIGGLSVLKEIRKQLPDENFIYIADSACTPYGNKTAEQIIQRCTGLVEELVSRGADIIVVACNSATAIAVNPLRQQFSIPIIAMEPAVKPAVKQSEQGKVGILATSMTLSSQRYSHLLERFAKKAQVIEQACPGLVECVENMAIDSADTRNLLHQYLDPLLERDVDTIVLGCTHYPFLREQIEIVTQRHVSIIDTGEAVTRELKRKLTAMKLNKKALTRQHEFYTTGTKPHFQQQLDYFWPEKVIAYYLDIDC